MNNDLRKKLARAADLLTQASGLIEEVLDAENEKEEPNDDVVGALEEAREQIEGAVESLETAKA